MPESSQSEHKKSEVAQKEEAILAFWEQEKIFEQTLEKESPQGEFVFYDGPPYGTGTAHYGHLLAGTIKDIIPRYKTMCGYHVPRRWGWDCHGLPIENLIEKELDLSSKKDIEAYGIDKFNEAARNSVLRYAADWEEIVPRTGRWVDMDEPYMTMQPSYMESVWWVFKTLFEKGLITEGFKPMHICPRCETPLANFEVNQGYAEVTDITVTAKFELADEPGTHMLAWTTTPWTLPGNVALAVGEDVTYVVVSESGVRYVVAKDLVESVFADKEYEIQEERKGSDLVGKSYRPVFDYYASDASLENHANGWKIYAADFVTTEEGTGVVHIAPAFGSDDMALGKEKHLPFIQHVDMSGHFSEAVTDFAGMLVKKKDDTMSTDIEIVKWLAHNDKLFAKKKYKHSYPLCWRCDTPLLNYATKSWFVDVPQIKDRLVANNQNTTWVPEHLRDGRFGKWLEGAREWAVSRSRFWGTPLPVWVNAETGKTLVVGGVSELKQYIKSSGNTYHVMRHGTAESNMTGLISARNYDIHPVTEEGEAEAKASIEAFDGDPFDLIIVSPLLRTRQTAEIVRKHFGLQEDQVIVDERLREQDPGDLEGKTWEEYHDYVAALPKSEWFTTPIANGESYQDVKRRAGDLLYELEEKYKDKKILFVTHGGVSWILNVLALEYLPENQVYQKANHEVAFVVGFKPFKRADLRPLEFAPVPHNANYDLDLHRPYIDHVVLQDDEGLEYRRIEEVFDVWFDSGSMPYGQMHYPFENEQLFTESRFPANFIAEGLDQTRGWFYVLMVLATALFDKPAFEQVIVNGLVLAEDGKKMSKRLKNYPEPRTVLDTYGADALRLFMVSLPVVRAESSSFTEKGVQDAGNKVMRRLRNVLSFYLLYRDGEHRDPENSPHVLDRWITARLDEVAKEITEALEAYQLDRGARTIFILVDDLSTWYVRRSRDRFKEASDDAAYARGTLRYVLERTAQILAPYVPFVSEEIWQEVRAEDAPKSVHLTAWPVVTEEENDVLRVMEQVRTLVSEALEQRAQAGIKVRQPLAKLTIPLKLPEELTEIIADELNVKTVTEGDKMLLDTDLTPELIMEGSARELVRHIQSMRKKAGLSPQDSISVKIAANDAGAAVVEAHKAYITDTTQIKDLHTEIGLSEGDVSSHNAIFTVTFL